MKALPERFLANDEGDGCRECEQGAQAVSSL